MDGMDVFFVWWFCSDWFDLYLPILGEGFIPSLASTQLENRGTQNVLKRFDYWLFFPSATNLFVVPGMSCFFQISLKGPKVLKVTSYGYVEDYCNTKAVDSLIDCSQMWADTVHIENRPYSIIWAKLKEHYITIIGCSNYPHTLFFQLKNGSPDLLRSLRYPLRRSTGSTSHDFERRLDHVRHGPGGVVGEALRIWGPGPPDPGDPLKPQSPKWPCFKLGISWICWL